MKRCLSLSILILVFSLLLSPMSHATEVISRSDGAEVTAILDPELWEHGTDSEIVSFSGLGTGSISEQIGLKVPLKVLRDFYESGLPEVETKEIKTILEVSAGANIVSGGILTRLVFHPILTDSAGEVIIKATFQYTYFKNADESTYHEKVVFAPTFEGIIFGEYTTDPYPNQMVDGEKIFMGLVNGDVFRGTSTETVMGMAGSIGADGYDTQYKLNVLLADLLSGGQLDISGQLPKNMYDSIRPNIQACGNHFRFHKMRASNPDGVDNNNGHIEVTLEHVEKVGVDQYSIMLVVKYRYFKEKGVFYPHVTINGETPPWALVQCPELGEPPVLPEDEGTGPDAGPETPEFPEAPEVPGGAGDDEVIFPDLPEAGDDANQVLDPENASAAMVSGGGFLSCSLPGLMTSSVSLDWLLMLPLLVPVIRRKKK